MEIWKCFKSFSRDVYIVLIGLLGAPFIIIFFLFLSVPNLIYRYMISKFSPCLRPDLGKMVTSVGHFFAVENMTEQSSRCVIALTVLFEGDLSLEELQHLWFSRVVNARNGDRLKYPELQQYITTFAFFKFWKRDSAFDVRNHIKHYHFPTLVKSFSFEDLDLHQIHEYLHNEPFPSKRSPWEIIRVGNFRHSPTSAETAAEEMEEPEPCVGLETSGKPLTLVALRFQHSLCDGYSLQRVFVEGFFGKNVKALQSPRPSFITGGGTGDKRKLYEKLVQTLLIPFSMFYEASLFLEMSLHRNVPWIVKERTHRQVVGLTPMIPINCIRDIKNYHKVSFTSVLVSAITGAVRNLLTTKTENPTFNELGMPVVFALPIVNHPDKLRNHFTFGFTNIPIHEKDPLLRLKRCHEIVERAKTSTGPLLGRCMMVLAGSMTSPIVKLITTNRVIPIIISNFPMSGIQLGLPDLKCLDVCGSAGPTRGSAGALIAMTSYVDTVRCSVTAEESLLTYEDLNKLTTYIREEIMMLHQDLM